MKHKDERCLCGRCKADYETAGYTVIRLYEIKYKDTCDKCDRLGWFYLVENK